MNSRWGLPTSLGQVFKGNLRGSNPVVSGRGHGLCIDSLSQIEDHGCRRSYHPYDHSDPSACALTGRARCGNTARRDQQRGPSGSRRSCLNEIANMIPKQGYHPSWEIAVAIASPLLFIIGVLGWLVAPTRSDAYINCAFVITFCAVGWMFGMILSPDSRVEEKKFNSLWKGICLFVSGYVVSKVDPLVDALLKPEVVFGAHDDVHTYRLLASLAATVLSAVLTYVIRVYAFTVGAVER